MIDDSALHALPIAEKLRIVELLWDDIGEVPTPIPLPEWVEREALRRREEMLKDPSLGISLEEVWRRIASRKG